MKFGAVIPHNEIGTDPGAIRDYAQGAEELGCDHLLVYDDAEAANEFDMEELFGSEVVARVQEPPCEGGRSRTIEDFRFNIDKLLKQEKPFVYILDSFDSIWRLQSLLLDEADRARVPIFQNDDTDDVFREIMRHIIATLSSDFSRRPAEVFRERESDIPNPGPSPRN